ncbi:MAG: sterol desaturase family protein [Rhodospirillales bacterium]|nr:sterol desaturase family protein [Rhodospirillales bacterium]
MFAPLDRLFSILAGWVDQVAIIPLLYRFGAMQWADLSFDWMLVCVYGLFALILTYAVCWPLEAWRPIEHWASKKAVAVDVFYTVLARVGMLPVASFLVFYQVQVVVNGFIVAHGYIPPTLETVLPWLMGRPVLAFVIYALILDGSDYWRHRLSHAFAGWYALHALHHAQRQMSFWSDDRNHLLDDLVAGVWFGVVGLAIGVPPLQFPLLLMFMRFIESLSHANVRLSFGWLGDRLLVSPRFHRIHHGLLAAGQHSCNYAAVFPIWDILFGTADFSPAYPATGDDAVPEAMASGGYLAQQWGGLVFFLRQLRSTRPAPAANAERA